MATAQQCETALHTLAERLASRAGPDPTGNADRTLSCRIRDLDLIFRGRLAGGRLRDIEPTGRPDAQIRIEVSGDDLLALVDGQLNAAAAWASGRLKVHAGVRDLLRLRSMF